MLNSTEDGIEKDRADDEPEHELGQHEGFQVSSKGVVLHHETLQGVQSKEGYQINTLCNLAFHVKDHLGENINIGD